MDIIGNRQDDMRCKVKILLVPPSSIIKITSHTEELIDHLESENYHVQLPAIAPNQTSGQATTKRPVDIILVDCRGEDFNYNFDPAFLDDLRKQSLESVFMFLTDLSVPATLRQKVKKYGSICATGQHLELLSIRLGRLLDSLALADECGERLKTLLLLTKGNSDTGGLRTSSKKLCVLIAGTPSPLSLRAMKSLDQKDIKLYAAITIPQTIRYLEEHSFDCLVLLPGQKTASHISLIKLLRRNGRTQKLPILVMHDHMALSDEPEKINAKYLYQGADLILDSHDSDQPLVREVAAFSRRSRLTKSMQQFLRKSIKTDNDNRKFSCTIPFFETHLARQCASAQKSGKPLCLSAFRLRALSGHAVSSHMQTQALSYIDLIAQDIDLVTAAQHDIVLISHPFTTPSEAQKISTRIKSVLQDISFKGGKKSGHKTRLVVAHNTVLLNQTEMPEQLITRALQNLIEDMPSQDTPSSATPVTTPYLSIVP